MRTPETARPSAGTTDSPPPTPGVAAPQSRRELRREAEQQAEPATLAPPATMSRAKTTTGAKDTSGQTPPNGTRPWRTLKQVGQSAGAALAITALVVGTALPALGRAGVVNTKVVTKAASDIRAQSFTAARGILPDMQVHGTFTATTPTELKAMQAATAAAAKSGVASIAKPGQVIYPMTAGSYTLTDGFGAARVGRSHMGQDFAAGIGTPIYAAADGCVTMSQESYQGYGVAVEVAHPQLSGSQAISTLYAHMEYGTRAVQAGECVTAGQFLGRVGNTGWTVGSVLHFEVRINESAIDPLAWLEANVF